MRVLVAEDDPVERAMLRAAVTRLGHACMQATNGDDAWEAICRATPDIIISDWRMPGLKGPEICRRLQAVVPATRPYFILHTMLASREHVVEAREAGVDAYLAKPVTVDDLAGRLSTAQERLAERRAAS